MPTSMDYYLEISTEHGICGGDVLEVMAKTVGFKCVITGSDSWQALKIKR